MVRCSSKRLAVINYEVGEIERHLHSEEYWFAAAAVPSGETHVGDDVGTNQTAYQLDAGNDTWGTWVQLLGSTDTPVVTGKTHYDPHRLEIVTAEHASTTYLIQIGAGASGAAALTANAVSTTVFYSGDKKATDGPMMVQMDRQTVGTKLWARCWAVNQNTGTVDFYLGIHEYDE